MSEPRAVQGITGCRMNYGCSTAVSPPCFAAYGHLPVTPCAKPKAGQFKALCGRPDSPQAFKALQDESRRSYARRDFNQTLELVDELVREEPEDARYHEMRAAVRVDDKKFSLALEDYDKALDSTPGGCSMDCWRVLPSS